MTSAVPWMGQAYGAGSQNSGPSFAVDLKTSLVPRASGGSATPTFTRATPAYVTGYASDAEDGASQTEILCASGEARFSGARRVSEGVWSDVLADGTPIPDAELLGYLREGARTQYLGVTASPATQTTASLGTGTYTLWVVGTGSATSSAGTATITGGGAATAGSPNTFVVTGAGTVTVTVAGTVTFFQLENGAFPSSRIDNAGAAGTSATRNADSLTYPTSGNISNTAGAAYAEVALPTGAAPNTGNSAILIDQAGGSTNVVLWLRAGGGFSNPTARDSAGNTPDGAAAGFLYSDTGIQKLSSAWGAAGLNTAGNGTSVTAVSYSGTILDGSGAFAVGAAAFGTEWFGTIRNVKIYPQQMTASQLEALTT